MTVWTMTILEENTDTELEVYLNTDDLVFIMIGEAREDYNSRSIILSKEDATNLRNELDKLIKLM